MDEITGYWIVELFTKGVGKASHKTFESGHSLKKRIFGWVGGFHRHGPEEKNQGAHMRVSRLI